MAVIILLLSTAITSAASYYWNVSSGDWSTTANWKTGIEPTSSDIAHIQNGGTATITETDEQCSFLYLGAVNSGTIEMTDGSLSVSYYSYVGYSGTGTFTQSGGANSLSNLDLGSISGASGTYNLSGSGQLFVQYECIGNSGTGTFTQTGGTNTTSTNLYLGLNSNSNGTYNLSGSGQLSAGYEYVGSDGTGAFTQSGGTNTISSQLYLGCNSGASGTYNLSGSGQLSAGYEYIGDSGTGAFIQTGGTNTISSKLFLGISSGASGTYNLSESANLSVSGTAYVGFSGTGEFLQTGGTNSTYLLYVGYNSSSSGMYNLSGTGQLSANYEYIGFNGAGAKTFTHSGGTNSVGSLYIGYTSSSTGTYNLSGSGQLSAGYEYIGYSGTGTFTQAGGTHTATYTKIGASGTYNLSAGTLNINGGFENQGVWNLSSSTALIHASSSIVKLSGTVLATAGNATLNIDAHSLLIVPSGFNPENYFTTYTNAGILHQAGSTLDIPSAYSIHGVGSSDDHVNCQGTLAATSGYAINLNGGLNISGTGSVDLESGTLYVNDTISGMSGGSLKASHQRVGSTGTGAFTQTGGTNTISSQLYLGFNSGASGTYNLSGTGQLSAGYEYIGRSGTGAFTQTGGTNTISSQLYLGFNSGASGTYNLSGTGQLSADYEYIGRSGTGAFTQTGGTNTISSFLFLGNNSSANGSYELSGSGQLSAANEHIGFNGTGTFTQSGGANSLSHLNLGSMSGASGTYNLSGSGQLFARDEFIGESGTGTFTQTGGTNTISSGLYLGFSSNSNGTYYLNGGTLILNSLKKGSGLAALNFGGGTLQAGGTLTCSLPMTLTGDGGNANIDTADNTVTLYGVLAGTGGLNKLGAGTLTLSATNTYTGATTILQGTLALSSSGSIDSSSTIDVQSGGTFNVSAITSGLNCCGTQTLKGAGTVWGSVVAASGSHIHPGDGIGTLTIYEGNLTLNTGALLDFDLAAPAASDKIYITAAAAVYTLFLNSQQFSDFHFSALDGFGAGTYTLIDAERISGSLGSNLTGTIGDYWATLSISDNDLILTLVPEPGAWLLLATACLAMFVYKRTGIIDSDLADDPN